MSEEKKFKVIGTRPIRHDGIDKVTGRAVYGADVQFPGMLFGQVLRSPHAHARILSIDTTAAEKLQGVHAVITAADIAEETGDSNISLGEGFSSTKFMRDNVLAHEKALYTGHAIAAAAATDPHIAEEAVNLIKVQYEELPPVLEVLEAMEDDAPLLHEDLTTSSLGEDTKKKSNIASHLQHKLGDVEKGFASAEHVVEREFRTATVHQGYIEPHTSAAMWNQDGHLTVWTSTQGAFLMRQQLSAVLGQPESHIRVIPTEIGGGFGGKIPVYLEALSARLSKKCGRPVKMTMNRVEEFEGTGPTPATFIRVKMGVDGEGKLTAAEAWLAYEAGAYPGSAVGAGALCIFSNYAIPNLLINGYDVVVNKPRSFAYRAPGSTQAVFASESVFEELAERLGLEPLEMRMENAAREGTRRADGMAFPRIGCFETMEAAYHHPHYKSALEGPNRGRGVAAGYWMNAGLDSTVVANVTDDGTVNLVEGSTDIGGTRTSIAMQFAEVLDIPVEDVNPLVGDTNAVGFTHVTGGSRTTFATGIAAIEAAKDVKRQMLERAAKLWETDPEKVIYENGTFSHRKKKEDKLTFKEVAEKAHETGGPIVGRASVNPETGVGGSYAASIVDVEVDPETGKTTILRFTMIQDAGKAIHPSYVEGQMQGGAAQGIGWALNEEYFYTEKGELSNASFLDYRMPTAFDLPPIETVIVEVPNPGHPFGVRGVGEASIVPPPAAIAHAIYNAIGVRLRELPMKPDRILAALQRERPDAAG